VGGNETFGHLRGILDETLRGLPETRRGRNTVYTMRDAGLGAFSALFMQSPSFLAHQQLMQTQRGFNNARTLFGIERIPTDNQIRGQLDPVAPTAIRPAFDQALEYAREGGALECFRTKEGHLLSVLDGTEYFRSTKIHCSQCSHTERANAPTEYSHMVVAAAIVAPGKPEVLPLVPEFVRQSEGAAVQDCELVAGQRWIAANGQRYRHLGLTILADDKYANQPTCKKLLEEGFHFILVCKPTSHPGLYESLEVDRKGGFVQSLRRTEWTGREHLIYDYQFSNEVPLRDGQDALQVNWMQLTITVKETGQQKYRNSFVTDFTITVANVQLLVEEGRTRWKIENENNNTLKTKGYHFEHNFGHGTRYLSETLLTLNLLAFLFHNLLELVDEQYRELRRLLKRRTRFYDDIRALTSYHCFASLSSLLRFMIHALLEGPAPPPDLDKIID
jgi:hypothetical protein